MGGPGKQLKYSSERAVFSKSDPGALQREGEELVPRNIAGDTGKKEVSLHPSSSFGCCRKGRVGTAGQILTSFSKTSSAPLLPFASPSFLLSPPQIIWIFASWPLLFPYPPILHKPYVWAGLQEWGLARAPE